MEGYEKKKEYEDFKRTLASVLITRYRSCGVKVFLDFEKRTKNNDVICEYMTIRNEFEQADLVPAFKMSSIYDSYQNGKAFSAIVDDIITTYRQAKADYHLDFEPFKDFDFAKSYIGCKVVGQKGNEKFLADYPHKNFLDLSAIFYLMVPDVQHTITIDKYLLHEWGITEAELWDVAINNNHKQAFEVQKMTDIFRKFELLSADDKAYPGFEDMVLVLSNASRIFGASIMLDDESMQIVARFFKGNYYIIPSSVHELLAVSCSETNTDELKEMVRGVNADRNCISREEILSDNVYFYSKENHELCMAND